jgi:hypothetical protein
MFDIDLRRYPSCGAGTPERIAVGRIQRETLWERPAPGFGQAQRQTVRVLACRVVVRDRQSESRAAAAQRVLQHLPGTREIA